MLLCRKEVHFRFSFQHPIVGKRLRHAYREDMLKVYGYSEETLYIDNQKYIEVYHMEMYKLQMNTVYV